ncbi:MAG: type II toxin-antitoxin system VapC family toxin [Prevotellaceae bacterium]|jgi:predicted nucleic acid-binding protein|nr:type II toxin-antitoxin system VapC family toxin [Prevotellaceae bacterium]
MGTKYLIDTNVVIDFSQNRFSPTAANFVAKVLDNYPTISVITQIELLGFSLVSQQIIDFVDIAVILGMNNSIISKVIELRKLYKIKLPDAIIAATAWDNNLILLTRNTGDFKNIDRLRIENPHF